LAANGGTEGIRMTDITGSDGTVRRTLDNGLSVIVRSERAAPIGSFWVWYRVGGRNEVPGITGVSHWAEHMLFKGTERYPKGSIFRTITANGGNLNGFTWLDYTAYYETLPIDRIDLSFDIESDRMVNARFDTDEVASERTVIISERQGNENSPTFLLNEDITATSFKAHPYGQGVIGYMSDLQSMTRDDLYGHYRTYYRPNNAVVVFVGDLDASEALDRIERYFGGLERGPEIPDVRTVEPEQFGERRVTLRRPAPNRVVSMVHRGVPASHPDAPALIALDAVLSGGKPMSFGGGASMGRSSRLYRALVATGLTASAGSSFALSIDPLLFGVSATLRPESDAEKVEQVISGELDRLASEPVGQDELQRALKQIRVQFTYSQQSVSSKAYLLGSLATVAPERTPQSLIDEVLAVTPDDLQRVAATYLSWSRRTTGWLIPGDPGSGKPSPNGSVTTAPAGYVPDEDDRALDTSMPAVVETRLENGLRVLTLDTPPADPNGPVVVRLRIPGGSALDAERLGVARFTAEMLTRGSGGRTLDDLAEELDGLGASISAGAGRENTDLTLTSMREDVDRVMELLATALLKPDFPADQIEIVRAQLLSGLRQAQQDTRAEAEHALRQMLYPDGHPYRERVSGTEESVTAMTRDDLVAFGGQAYKPSNALVAIAGGLTHDEAVDLVSRHLGGWNGETPALVIPDVPAIDQSQRVTKELPGKSQADVAIGGVAIPRLNPDFHALNVGNLILGRLGLMGRLGESVREKQGLAYYAFSGLEVGLGTGFWSARAGVNPENVERAIETILSEVRAYLEGGPTSDEFSDAIGNLTGSLPLGLETVGSISSIIADIGFFDLGLDYLQRYRSIIQSLTPEQIVETMRRYVDPERLAIAVVRPAGTA
jgi:zinc protease